MLDPVIEAVLEREGVQDDNAADRGGFTRYGITLPFYTDFLRWTTGNQAAVANRADLEALDLKAARAVYGWYMSHTRIGEIVSAELRGVVFDMSVNHGLKPAVKCLQRALGVFVDGVLGAKTLFAANKALGDQGIRLAIEAATYRQELYADIVAGNLEDKDKDGIPDNVEFIRGWTRRNMAMIRELA